MSTSTSADQVRTAEEQMSAAAVMMENTADQFSALLTSVGGSWQTMSGQYGGQSANAMGAAIQTWERQFGRVITLLEDMSRRVKETIAAYDAAEDTSTGDARTLASQLPGLPNF